MILFARYTDWDTTQPELRNAQRWVDPRETFTNVEQGRPMKSTKSSGTPRKTVIKVSLRFRQQ